MIPETFVLLLLMNFKIIQLFWLELLHFDSENKTLLISTVTDCLIASFNAKIQNDFVSTVNTLADYGIILNRSTDWQTSKELILFLIGTPVVQKGHFMLFTALGFPERIWENTDQNNYEYVHFLCSVKSYWWLRKRETSQTNHMQDQENF